LHGKYPVPKKLDLDLLKQIRAKLPSNVNISLHGGSGTPEHYYVDAAHLGVQKVNINSDLRIAFRQNLERVLVENPHEMAIVKLMPEVYQAVQRVVERKIKAFGSANKALK